MSPTRTVRNGAVELVVDEAGAGFPIVFLHGFPELAFSWRHQLPALAAAGYHALAPDMRGYGRSSRPDAVGDYDMAQLTGDVLAILDAIDAEQAIIIGHDFGSMVAWQFSLLHPERTAGVVGMSVPFIPRSTEPPITMLRMLFGEMFFYILYFQEPGVADAELGADPHETVRRLMCAVVPEPGTAADPATFAADGRGFLARIPESGTVPTWITAGELAVYGDAFTATGFTGPLNWYRNFDRNWELSGAYAEARVTMPSLFVGGARDPVLTMMPPDSGEGWLLDHRGAVLVPGAGHWVQQEAPAEVNAALVTFADSIRPRGGS